MDFLVRLLEGMLQLIQNFFLALGSFAGMGDYGSGFLAGFVLTSFLGFVVYRLNIWARQASAAYQPQRLIQMTARTPSQVMNASSAATMRIAGVAVIALTLVMWLVGLANPQDAAITGGVGVLLLLVGGITG